MKKIASLTAILSICIILGIVACNDKKDDPIPEPEEFTVTNFADQLRAPIGFTLDNNNRLWVTEAGTGQNDGSIVMITPEGVKTTVATGFPSVVSNGSIEGMSHPLYKDGKLYVLHGISGMLYTADVSSFQPGNTPLNLNTFQKEDIGTYVRSQNLTNPLNSNIFDLLFGADGHLYIADAGANALIRRDKSNGALSVFARIPDLATGVEAVPTGVVFDGERFLVSVLGGFPFTPGNAKIFQISTSGTVSEYKGGFTNLSHLTLSKNNKPIVLQLGNFGAGFEASTGRVLNEDGDVLLSGLTMPTDIVRSADREFYLLSYAQGTIKKLKY
ncbi:hypothetical protein DYBT9275_03096 [Dyadobacter sp. CECT 9275]|uniref:ScyD/ScyE family protein n=1 Tax=Dyadobacter helix TaxID=2822344 RepID=A0A916N521_9BACT|nr:ScyD/ScyE family protein [Dyadobacter sp. CECT 9275]CAG5003204.1 hypothetical protein DYBT9275_03096 [Dyadobacter sp. CECT 9275]